MNISGTDRVKLLNEAISAAENDLKQFSESEEKRLLEQYQKVWTVLEYLFVLFTVLHGHDRGMCGQLRVTAHKEPTTVATVKNDNYKKKPNIITGSGQWWPASRRRREQSKELIRENEEALRECKSKLVNELVAAVIDIEINVPDAFRYFVNRNSNWCSNIA